MKATRAKKSIQSFLVNVSVSISISASVIFVPAMRTLTSNYMYGCAIKKFFNFWNRPYECSGSAISARGHIS
jgi:hypothetical protein